MLELTNWTGGAIYLNPDTVVSVFTGTGFAGDIRSNYRQRSQPS
jgi:hypothetical protein